MYTELIIIIHLLSETIDSE